MADSVFPSTRTAVLGRWLVATVKTAYRFALAPSPAQEHALRSHAGAARFAWNWGLGQCKERYAAERQVVLRSRAAPAVERGEEGRPGPGVVGGELQVRIPGGVPEPGSGAVETSSSRRRACGRGKGSGSRGGRRSGKARDSFRLTGALRCAAGDGHAAPPRHASHARGHRCAGVAGSTGGTARILSATVSPDRAAVVRLVHRRRRTRRPGAPRPARLRPSGSTSGSRRC